MYILGGPPAHNFSTVVPNGIAWKPQAPHATEGLNMDPIKGGKNIFGPTIEAKIPSNWSFYLSHPHKSTKEIISSTYFTPVHHGGHHGGACLKLDRKLSSVCFISVDSALVDSGQWASWWKVGLSRQSRVECWCFQILSILSPAFVPTTAAAWRVLIFSRLSPLFWEHPSPEGGTTLTKDHPAKLWIYNVVT